MQSAGQQTALQSLHANGLQNIMLGIVCPMANERENAIEFIQQLLNQCEHFRQCQLFAVFDQACTDGTVDLVRQYAESCDQVRVVWAPENQTVVDAYARGYREALAAGCDWVLEIDAGFSHDPREFPRFFQKIGDGYACIFGSRFLPGGAYARAPLSRKLLSKAGTLLSNFLLGTKLSDMTSGYEFFRRDALEHVLRCGVLSRGHFFQTEIKYHCRELALCEVPISYRSPSKSVSFRVIFDSVSRLMTMWAARWTRKP